MFNTDGVLREVNLPLMPTLKATVSAKANSGLWQLAQLMEESSDKMRSLNNFSPNSIRNFFLLPGSMKENAATTVNNKTATETILLIRCNLLKTRQPQCWHCSGNNLTLLT